MSDKLKEKYWEEKVIGCFINNEVKNRITFDVTN
jgi:hypothetical protein